MDQGPQSRSPENAKRQHEYGHVLRFRQYQQQDCTVVDRENVEACYKHPLSGCHEQNGHADDKENSRANTEWPRVQTRKISAENCGNCHIANRIEIENWKFRIQVERI